jgi:hypothetical protein
LIDFLFKVFLSVPSQITATNKILSKASKRERVRERERKREREREKESEREGERERVLLLRHFPIKPNSETDDVFLLVHIK